MNYNTNKIVEIVAAKIKNSYLDLLNYNSFDTWKEKYLKIENKIKTIFPENVQQNFPLHDDVLKLVIKVLFNKMPFSKPYILKKYEHEFKEKSYLLFPAKKPKRLIILFSGLSGHKTYNRYSWYWDEGEMWERDTVYLFLNDLDEHWYVGTDKKPTREIYIKIIQHVLNKFKIDRRNTFTVGGSMGAYGALLFAIDMGLKGAIAIHPQTNYKSVRKHKANDWEEKIRESGAQFYDLDDFIFKRDYIPFIYIEYGDYESDKEAAEKFIHQLQKREIFIIIRKTANKGHVTNNPSKTTIESIISTFENTGFDDEFIK